MKTIARLTKDGDLLIAGGLTELPLKQTFDTQAEWEAGALWRARVLGGKLELGIATAASEVTRVEDTTAEFGEGTLSGVKAESNYLRMVNTPTLQFNGSSTYVWLGNLTALKVSKPRLKAWFRTSSSSDQVIVRWRLHGPCLDMQSGKVRFVIGRTDFTATIVTSPSTYNDGKWHLAEGYFNGSTAYLWVDGTQVASASCSGIGYGDGGAAIGRDGDSSGAYFSGDIAYVEWLNDSTLVKRWKLDEGSGSKAYDQGNDYYNIYNGSWRTNYFNYETNQGTDAWRISPAWGGHEVIDGSEISWTTTLPTGTAIKVYTGINSSSTTPPTSWTQAASGNAISGAGAGTDLTGKYIWVKAVLTTTAATSTPQLNSLTIKVTRRAKRYAKGTWRNPPLSLDAITEAAGSLLSQIAATAPTGTAIKYLAGISASDTTEPGTWYQQTPEQALSVITQAGDYSGNYLWIEIELTTTDVYKTPEVDSFSIEITGKAYKIMRSVQLEADQEYTYRALSEGDVLTSIYEDTGTYPGLDDIPPGEAVKFTPEWSGEYTVEFYAEDDPSDVMAKLERGNIPSDWTPAPEDYLTLDRPLGELAFADQVQLAMLGETIIVGGFLKTELIKAKSIVADHLNVDDLAAISGNFSGNVLIGGDLLVGGQGVLSVFQYISTGDASNADGWSNLGGYEIGGTVFFGHCRITVPVPERFVITKATLTVEAMARYTYDEITQTGYWSQSKNLKIYKASGDRGYHYYPIPSGDTLVGWDDISDITNDVWSVSAWSPPLVPASPSPGNIPYIQRRSGSVKDYLTAGQSATFMVEANVADPGSGVGRMIVVVEGYVRPEGLG